MLVIFPQRAQELNDEDRDFIITTLAGSDSSKAGLTDVLADPELVEIVLDNDALYAASLNRIVSLPMPSQTDFYLLVRPALQRVGLDDRAMARYLAALLSSFSYAERTPDVLPQEVFSLKHLSNLTQTLRDTTEEGRFMVLSYMGNYALLMSGLFPEKIPYASESRETPDHAYCDKLGRASFQAAAHHRLADEYLVKEVFESLWRSYGQVRIALNDLAEQGIFNGVPA